MGKNEIPTAGPYLCAYSRKRGASSAGRTKRVGPRGSREPGAKWRGGGPRGFPCDRIARRAAATRGPRRIYRLLNHLAVGRALIREASLATGCNRDFFIIRGRAVLLLIQHLRRLTGTSPYRTSPHPTRRSHRAGPLSGTGVISKRVPRFPAFLRSPFWVRKPILQRFPPPLLSHIGFTSRNRSSLLPRLCSLTSIYSAVP
jgi:hypothetical protein